MERRANTCNQRFNLQPHLGNKSRRRTRLALMQGGGWSQCDGRQVECGQQLAVLQGGLVVAGVEGSEEID